MEEPRCVPASSIRLSYRPGEKSKPGATSIRSGGVPPSPPVDGMVLAGPGSVMLEAVTLYRVALSGAASDTSAVGTVMVIVPGAFAVYVQAEPVS